jgi:HEAT repeat protein
MKIGMFVAVGLVFLGAKPVIAAESGLEEVVSSAVPAKHTACAMRSAPTTDANGDDLAIDELLKITDNEEESLRIAAVQVLGEMATPRAKAILGVILYGNSMGTVRAAAADQLGNFGDGDSVFTLALALETERDAEVRDVIAANLERSLPADNAPAIKVADLTGR